MTVNQKAADIFSKIADLFVVYSRSVEFTHPYNC